MTVSYRQMTLIFLGATILLLPFSHFKIQVLILPLYLPEISVIFALGTFLMHQYTHRTQLPSLDRWLLMGALFFLLGSMLSFILNVHSLTGLGMIKSWFIFPLLFGLLLWYMTQNVKEQTNMIFIWYVVLCCIGLRSLSYLLSGHLTYDGRLSGDYSSPNFLAFTLAPAILISFWYILVQKADSRWWFLSLFTLSFLFPVFFATHSYGAWGGLLAAMFVSMVLKRNAWFTMRMSLCVASLVIVALGSFLYFEQGSEKWQALIGYSERSALASRVMIWQAALKIVADNPLIGIGIGRFQSVYLSYQAFFPPYLEWAVPEPHNVLLAVYLATGLIGFLGFVLMFGRLIVLLWPKNKNNTISNDGDISSGFFLSLIALFVVYGIMDTPLFTTELSYTLFLWFALAIPREKIKD